MNLFDYPRNKKKKKKKIIKYIQYVYITRKRVT